VWVHGRQSGLPEGSTSAIVGESGSGKWTLLQHINAGVPAGPRRAAGPWRIDSDSARAICWRRAIEPTEKGGMEHVGVAAEVVAAGRALFPTRFHCATVVYDQFARLRDQESVNTVLVTHDVRETLRLADRLMLPRVAVVQRSGSVSDVVRSPANDNQRGC